MLTAIVQHTLNPANLRSALLQLPRSISDNFMSISDYIHLLTEVMFPMALLVAAGAWWRRQLGAEGVVLVRGYISTITLHLFVPALLFASAATATINEELLSVPVLVGVGVLISGGVLYLGLRLLACSTIISRPTRAGLLLCGMFGNVLFMGYPLLHYLYGDMGSQYAVFADMGASTPLLWSLGVWVASHIGGQQRETGHPLINWLKLPPVSAFFSGLLLGHAHLPITPLVHAARFIGQPTVPVMLLMLGLSIPWHKMQPNRMVAWVVVYKLILLPLMILGLARFLFGVLRPAQISAVIESGVPTMLMMLTLADRYHLDIETTALTIAWTTIGFLLTLPMWLMVLNLDPAINRLFVM